VVHVLCDEESVFRDLFDHAFDALWVLNGDMHIEHANAAAATLSGFDISELIGQPLSVLLPEGVAEKHAGYVEKYKKNGKGAAVLGHARRFELRARDGSLIPIQLKAFRLSGPGEGYRFGATMIDLREQVRLEQEQKHMMAQLERLALVDPLTELWNRRAFDDGLSSQCAFVARHQGTASLALIDIDHFKAVNDTYGHAAGDKVLQQLALHLKRLVRKEDICARIGGEEFGILMPATDVEGAKMVIERALHRVATDRFDIGEGRGITITFSAGVAGIDGSMIGETVLERSDVAMYRAKDGGRARVEVWTPAFDAVLDDA